ncbi:hypothetical protein [Paenibacillus hamazuiensis]|uniref:hypothetical protein n=1 Tax=Paenibacillus hamazuiensis TaxID=2936508 RepID=UPI00200F11E2|nr:hypothetical protein [Paenibacillus hamazuiensis]
MPSIINVMFCDGGRYWTGLKTKTARVLLDNGFELTFTLGEDCTVERARKVLIPVLVSEAAGKKRKRG